MVRRLLLAALLATPALAQSPWPEDATNPQPAQGDLVLPMPCGGAMVFRRVETPAGTGPLEDRAVSLGSAETDTGYLEYLRRAFLVGPFGGGGAAPHYFIGKYEVTAGQFAAATGTCREPDGPSRLPMVDVSWFQAIDFTARYSTWLMQNARDRLPRRGDAPAFVRLPTEAEWEYAARGGAAVSDSDFEERVFPMPDGGPLRYAWVAGPRSSNGRLSRVGLLRPNPLGLHDILGNAAEWVLEPFRLNRVGRDHGLAGGLVARGGDFRTTEALLRSSQRVEYAPIDPNRGEPTRLPSIGFRVVLAAPAAASLADTARLREAFARESRAADQLPDDPIRVLEALRQSQPDPTVQAGLDRLRAAFAQEQRGRSDIARTALRAQIESAAVIARGVALADSRAGGLQRLVDQGRTLGATDAQIANYRELVAGVRREIEDGLRAYGRILTEMAAQRDVPLLEQAGVLLQELRAQNIQRLEPLVEMVVKHVNTTRISRVPTRDVLLREILAADRR